MLKKHHRFRVLLFGFAFCVLTAMVIARLANLQIARHEQYLERADRQQNKRVVVQAQRGDILDRRGRPLANSAGTLSLYTDNRYLRPPHADLDLGALAYQISHYADQDPDSVRRRLAREGVVPVARQLPPENAHQIGNILDDYGIDGRGYWLHRESKRLYPRGLAPHIIGFCSTDGDGDNKGQSGLELVYNEVIQGQRIEARSRRTGISQTMDPVEYEDLLSAQGHTLLLTIDSAIQETAEKALARACEEWQADSGGVVVQDARTGGILTMASWPTFDNQAPGGAEADFLRNRMLTDPLETGSVVKLYTAAILLDTDKIRIDSPVDCEGGRAYIDGRRVSDSPGHYLDTVPFYEVLRHSSNIGIIKTALALENEEWYRYLRDFGFGQKTGIDLPGEGAGLLYHPDRWTKFSRTSLPMGYEIALTPIQITNAITALVNGGEVLEPYVVAEVRDARGNVVERQSRTVVRRVIRPSTSLQMRYVMEDVVVNGTGKKAQVPGFRVGGKTGTTRKSHVLTHREYIASFAGALPIDDPRVTIYCYIDNPKGAYYASTVAAPLFQEVAQASVVHLGLVPSETGGEKAAPVLEEYFGKSTKTMAKPKTLDDLPDPTDMPNLTGLTMAAARKELPPTARNVRFMGSGRLVDQVPAAGESVSESTMVVLTFSPPAPAYADVSPSNAKGRSRR
ncbi:MAG: penicillin-binding transpeptidase domain-containing protein [Sumerlaeia bacterium]